MSRVSCNTYVAVILTKYGAEILTKHYAQFCLSPAHKREREFYEGQQVRYPLWEVMHIFGGCLTMGCGKIPFEGHVIEFLR